MFSDGVCTLGDGVKVWGLGPGFLRTRPHPFNLMRSGATRGGVLGPGAVVQEKGIIHYNFENCVIGALLWAYYLVC